MKRTVCTIICCLFILNFSFPAFATNEPVSKYSIQTEFVGIKSSVDNQYAIVDSNGDFLPIGRLDVNINDPNSVNKLLQEEVSDEVKQYIVDLSKENRDHVTKQGCEIVTIFSPELLDAERTRSASYTSYKGMDMKSEYVFRKNIASGYRLKVTGTRAKTVAGSLKEIGIFIAGIRHPSISLGATLLSIFEQAVHASVEYASANDFTYLQLYFDDTKQWTYGKADGTNWVLGYCSQYVKINKTEEFQQFVVNGVGEQTRTFHYPNKIYQSSCFDSPWETAYYHLNSPLDEWISYELYGKTWYF